MLNSEDPKVLMDPEVDVEFNDDEVQRVIMAAKLCIDLSARLRPNVSEVRKSSSLLFRFCKVHICSYLACCFSICFHLQRTHWLYLHNFGVFLGWFFFFLVLQRICCNGPSPPLADIVLFGLYFPVGLTILG